MDIVINDFVSDASYGSFGEQAPLKKSFRWFTDIVSFDNRKEQRNQTSEFPIRSWNVNWVWMDKGARDKLIEIYQRAKGRYENFLYRDYDDNLVTVTDWDYTAVGGETTTQLQKTYYKGETEEWTEDKDKIEPSDKYAPTIKVDNVTLIEGTDFTLDDSTGIIDWTSGSAPHGALSAAEVVTADYKFYFKVRFTEDTHLDIQHQKDWWAVEELILVEDVS
jgi:uncharacterized protein (TIGR02217 family)